PTTRHTSGPHGSDTPCRASHGRNAVCQVVLRLVGSYTGTVTPYSRRTASATPPPRSCAASRCGTPRSAQYVAHVPGDDDRDDNPHPTPPAGSSAVRPANIHPSPGRDLP